MLTLSDWPAEKREKRVGQVMYLGKNIQYLRKQKQITQEQLGERMGVSRQTVFRWEAGDAVPELDKLVVLCELFSCKLDELVRERLPDDESIYSEVVTKRVAPFTMARYVIVSPNPEDDVNGYMRRWAQQCGLLALHPDAMLIGWDFPFVSMEQQNRFGLRGYVAAYVLPEGFSTDVPGVAYEQQDEADYAVITVRDPFAAPFERIPKAYRRVLESLQANGFREKQREHVLSCFEHVYEKHGVTFMDVYVHAEGVNRADLFTSFS